METPYKRAWTDFKKSDEFANLLAIAKTFEPDTKPEYLENRIRRAFDAGWGARERLVIFDEYVKEKLNK